MANISLHRGHVATAEDLGPGVRPRDACEKDATVEFERADGRIAQLDRRVRVITLVAPDQNTTYEAIKDMGRATGEDATLIPCDGHVEMSQIWDLLEKAVEDRRERARIRALFLPEKQQFMRDRLVEMGLEAIETNAGRSVSGPLVTRQRST